MGEPGATEKFIEKLQGVYGSELVPSRRAAEQDARALLDSGAGEMSADDALTLGRYLNTGTWAGREHHNRFSPMFHGATMQKLTADMDQFNEVTAQLWKGDQGIALDTLDRIYKDPSFLPGAGRSYPSILMYLRDPEGFAIDFNATHDGLVALSGIELPDRSAGKDGYLAFCEEVAKLRDQQGLAPQEVDAILAAAYREARGSEDDGDPTAWDEFIDWARIFYEDPDFDSIERAFKLDLGVEVSTALEALRSGRDWWDPLHAAFHNPKNNLTRFDQHDAYLNWARDHREEASRGLGSIWDSDRQVTERIRGFMNHFPIDVLPGTGMRATIASVLLLADNPNLYPPYKPTTLNDGYRLVGYAPDPSGANEAQRYGRALEFLDRVLDEAAQRDLGLRDRLDAQSVLWAVLRNELPETATDDQRKALALYREDFRPAWWVNQGATFSEELAGGYVWAPQKTKSGFSVKHHTDVRRMKRGDTVLHYASGAIRAIGLVTKSAHDAERPS